MTRARAFWNTRFMNKWGRLILFMLICAPFFIYFRVTGDTRNRFILVTIIAALFIGSVVSILTTEKYFARSLGLLGIIVGSALYFSYIYIIYIWKENYDWLADLTRSIFIIAAPMFSVATVVTVIQRRKRERDARPK